MHHTPITQVGSTCLLRGFAWWPVTITEDSTARAKTSVEGGPVEGLRSATRQMLGLSNQSLTILADGCNTRLNDKIVKEHRDLINQEPVGLMASWT